MFTCYRRTVARVLLHEADPEGIEHVCFNVEESEGDHVSESFGRGDVEQAYGKFLGEFWRLSAAGTASLKRLTR